MSWRFEALLVLAWALGYLEQLPSPAAPTDGSVVAALFRDRTIDELRAAAHVRSGAGSSTSRISRTAITGPPSMRG